MAITITDLRTLVDHANAVGSWTSPVTGESISVFTSEPVPVEATSCLGMVVSTQTSDILFPIAATDLTDTLIYVWGLANGNMDTLINGGVGVALLDATPDEISYHIAGSDAAGFRHGSGPVNWQCFVIDTSNLPTSFTALAGTEGGLAVTAITGMGLVFKTLTKSVGGANNCYIDTVRYGNQGIEITAGTVGVPSLFTDIAAEDRSGLSNTAYGICRELGAGLFGLQGSLTFGDADDVTPTFFADTNKTITFEDRGLATNKYALTVRAGGATGTTTFRMGTISGTEKGVDGVDFICPAGVGAKFDASDTNLQSLLLYGSSFTNFDQGMLFSADGTNGPNHDVFSCAFTGCSEITIGTVAFKNNTISGSVGASAALISTTTNVSDLVFTSGGTGHGVTITSTGTYDFTNITFNGYALTDGSTGDEGFYNNSGGLVTINVAGGDVPSIRNGAGASTTIVAAVTITLTSMKDLSEVRVYSAGTTTEVAGVENVVDGTTDNRSFSFSTQAGLSLDIKVFNLKWIADTLFSYAVPSVTTSIPIAQRVDRVYSS